MSSPNQAVAPPAPVLPWPPNITKFLQNIGDGFGYFHPRILGHHASGTAVQVTRTEGNKILPTDKEMVLKVVNLSDKENEWRETFSEVQVDALRKLAHENLIKCHKVFADPSGAYWFMELDLFHCNLSAAVRKHDGKRLPEDRGKIWCRQIVSALNYLHENHWPHRDLKMENILVTSGDQVVIADYAFTHEHITGTPNSEKGSLRYAAPEMLKDPNSCDPFPADVWSMGAVIYAMHAGEPPVTEKKILPTVWREHRDVGKAIKGQNFSPSLTDLLHQMLQLTPTRRPSLPQVMCHPWFADMTAVSSS